MGDRVRLSGPGVASGDRSRTGAVSGCLRAPGTPRLGESPLGRVPSAGLLCIDLLFVICG